MPVWRPRLLVALILLVAGGLYAVWPRSQGGQDRIEASGTIEATQVEVAPKVAGRVARIYVREGDEVRAGQMVAALEAEELAAQVAQARANLRAAQARLAQAEAALGLQRAQYQAAAAQAEAAVDAARIRLLQARESTELQRSTVAAQLSQAEAQLDQARAQRRAAEANLRAITRTLEGNRATLRVAQAALRTAEANLAAARAQLDRARADAARSEALYQAGAIAAQQVDVTRTQLLGAEAAHEVARAQMEAARAQRDAVASQIQALVDQRRAAMQAVAQAAALEAAARASLEAARAGRRQLSLRVLEEEGARAQLSQAEATLRSTQATAHLVEQRAHEVEAARAAVDQARAALRLAEANRSESLLRTPISGVVLARLVEVGDLVSPGAPVLTVADLQRPYLRVFVPEADLGRVRLGQRVEVRVDAFPRRTFTGRVVEIANRAEYTPGNVQTREERTKLVFAVKIAVVNPGGVLKPGLPADAVIRVQP